MEATVRVGWHGTPFGSVFLAITARGISRIDFTSRDHPDLPLDRLRLAWPLAEFVHDQKGTLDAAAAICQPPHSTNPLRLYVPATRFQSAVWQALLQIPSGTVVSYSQLASVVGRPRASRAVGNAVGANPVACLIPCHRVIQQNGALGSYRWGSDRKQRILSWESRQCQSRAGG
ncbi:MAG: methylated-DNA--[protein]-cysteine S-methyltransferase [Halomonadaceae bacterium]|nr:MAG: methylated-DNA--[protein]-cysteine S-methyltransferase [Halomonadaceae bacterium]